MILLGLDFETTGLNFDTDRITEIGAVLWDTKEGKPIALHNHLVKHDDAPPITEEVEQLTGITQAMRGYRWHGESKTWRKIVKENLLDAERAEAGFEISIVEP